MNQNQGVARSSGNQRCSDDSLSERRCRHQHTMIVAEQGLERLRLPESQVPPKLQSGRQRLTFLPAIFQIDLDLVAL